MKAFAGELARVVEVRANGREPNGPCDPGAGRGAKAGVFVAVVLVLICGLENRSALASDSQSPGKARPGISSDRWREDWSSLADPANRTRAFDGLKYISLSDDDPKRYVSFGVTLREIFESSDAPAFGTMARNPSDDYWLHRAQFHVDVRFSENLQLFTQIEDVRAFEKTFVSPTDANKLDLRLAFLAYSRTFDNGVLRARVGRQDFVFDLERFISAREGTNVRQSFDALWASWETPKWRVYGLLSQPVFYRNDDTFDDTSTGDSRLFGVRLEHQLQSDTQLTGYYALYKRSSAFYLDGSGEESRRVVDLSFVGRHAPFDWDIEAMAQFGSVGAKDISAWAFGARAGYTSSERRWAPRFGMQFDVASGDRRPGDGTVGTFHPLFPHGFYFSLGGHTGYTNLVHLKPSLSVKPTPDVTLTMGLAALWRLTTNDAVYTLPSIPVLGTAGQGSSWTGAYAQLRAEYRFSPEVFGSVEFVRYNVGSSLRDAGGHDSNYLRVETKFSW